MNIMNNIMNPRIRMKSTAIQMTVVKTIQEIPQDMEKSTKHSIWKKNIYIYKQIQNSMYSIILMLKRDTN